MASSLEIVRDELYSFFDKEIAPIIRKEDGSVELCKQIVIKFNAKFNTKYKYIAKRYGNSIRVSANYCPLGIIFFMAATKSGCEDAKFKDPCYWGKVNKTEKI